jgi:hypothetical protein
MTRSSLGHDYRLPDVDPSIALAQVVQYERQIAGRRLFSGTPLQAREATDAGLIAGIASRLGFAFSFAATAIAIGSPARTWRRQ